MCAGRGPDSTAPRPASGSPRGCRYAPRPPARPSGAGAGGRTAPPKAHVRVTRGVPVRTPAGRVDCTNCTYCTNCTAPTPRTPRPPSLTVHVRVTPGRLTPGTAAPTRLPPTAAPAGPARRPRPGHPPGSPREEGRVQKEVGGPAGAHVRVTPRAARGGGGSGPNRGGPQPRDAWRTGKRQNIQQRVFARGHPPYY